MPVAEPGGRLARRAVRPTRASIRGPQRTAIARPNAPVRPTIASAVAPVAGGGSSMDYSSDPMLQRARALAQQNIASAQAAELAQRQAALIDYGFDPNFASLYGDQNAAGAAKGNTMSVLARLARQHEDRARNLDENLNKSNLYYSGYRGTQIAREGQDYLGEQYTAAQQLRALLSGYSGQLAGVRSNENERVYNAEQDAYQRALDFALQYGGGGGGGGGGGATARTAVAMAPRAARPTAATLRRAVARPRPRQLVTGHHPGV